MVVLQVNAGKRAISTQWCVDFAFEIALIQEPNWKSINDLKTVGNLIVGGPKPRACVVAKANYCILPQFSSKDIVVAVNENTLICSFYLAMEDADETMIYLEKALEYGSHKGMNVLAAGDGNCRSVLWSCEGSCLRGERMEQMILNNNLTIANVGNVPTFETGVGKSIIDFTVSTMVVEGWRVLQDSTCGSDHHPITYCVRALPRAEAVRKRNWRKADWGPLIDDLERYAESRFYPEWSEEILDQAVEAMTAACHKAINNHVPWKEAKLTFRRWWNESCTKSRAAYKRAKARHRRNRSEVSLANLVSAKASYKKAIFDAKELSWRNFVQETNGLDEMA